MSLKPRMRRRVGIPPQIGPSSSGSPEVDHLFAIWGAASGTLRSAEHAGGPPDTLLGLATEVIRARNALTRAQIEHGWAPSTATIEDLERDELLVEEADERRL